MKNPLTGILLVNLGTPDSPKPKDVYKYLVEFLTDERVIDLPWLQRQLLVRGLIIPKRYKQSARFYQQIWTAEGSPLMVYGKKVQKALQKSLGECFYVELAMRYQNPSLEKGLKNILEKGIQHLMIFPMFPQYASATTGSVFQKIMKILHKRENFPRITFIDSFPAQPDFVEAFCQVACKNPLDIYDHYLFSFHGLPQRQIFKADRFNRCLKTEQCCEKSDNVECYAAQCHVTYHAIVEKLSLPKEKTTLSYQSRLGKDPWMEPFTPIVLEELVRKGKKNVLVFCPSFVCDCLETLYEIGVEYAHEFRKKGGQRLDLVQGLNDEPVWIDAIKKIISEHDYMC